MELAFEFGWRVEGFYPCSLASSCGNTMSGGGRVLVQIHFVDAITQSGRVVTEPGAVEAPSAKGAKCKSLGQRPRKRYPHPVLKR